MLSSRPVHPRIRPLIACPKWAAIGVCVLLAVVIVLGIAGMRSPLPPREITHRKPYADFIGREYRVTSSVSAYAWNDFPDRSRILSISLLPPPGVRNRFVSHVTPLQHGQRIRIVSAWQELPSFVKYYVVSVPGAELPKGIPIEMQMKSDGNPDSGIYAPIDR